MALWQIYMAMSQKNLSYTVFSAKGKLFRDDFASGSEHNDNKI